MGTNQNTCKYKTFLQPTVVLVHCAPTILKTTNTIADSIATNKKYFMQFYVIKACLYKYENANYTSIVYSLGTSMFSKTWATEMINEQFEFL